MKKKKNSCGDQIGKDQSIKQIFIRKDRSILAKKSVVLFNSCISSNSLEELPCLYEYSTKDIIHLKNICFIDWSILV